jgi:hypothetical protein
VQDFALGINGVVGFTSAFTVVIFKVAPASILGNFVHVDLSQSSVGAVSCGSGKIFFDLCPVGEGASDEKTGKEKFHGYFLFLQV